MEKVAIIIITILSWNICFAQSDIDIPNFESVEVDYDLKDYVSISINKKGEIWVENKIVSLHKLKDNLFQELSRKAKYEGLRLPISIIELIADKDLEFEKLNAVLIELRKLSFLKVQFVCNSESEIRTEGLKTTGYLYKMNSINNSQSIILEVTDSLNSEMERILKTRGKNIEEFRKSIVAPSPPPLEITASKLKSGEINIRVIEIEISNEYFTIENQKFTSKELRKQMTKWNSKEPIAYILAPNRDCHYQKFLTPLSEIKYVLNSLWEVESINEFKKEYNTLDYMDKRKIRNRYPFIMVMDE